ncbi:MAG: hypothetical protein E7362_05595 [Clostridiales bacterium]|nr:hypothetical protein [Clostridiales bacterium]
MSKTKRISLITLLTTLILSMLAFVAVNMGNTFAMAYTPATFAFEDGASVKVIEDGGMRFRLQMDETTASMIKESSDDLVFYVVPEVHYEENMEVSDLDNLLFENCGFRKAQKVVADKNKIYNGIDVNGDSAYFSNCLLDINLAEFDGDYNTVNFIVFAHWNGNLVESASRNMYDVLQSAVLDGKDTENAYANPILDDENSPYGWFGGEDYPIVIDTQAKYNNFVQKGLKTLNANISVEVKNTLENKIEINKDELPVNNSITHRVNFYNNEMVLIKSVDVKDGENVDTADIPELPESYWTELLCQNNSNYVKGMRYSWSYVDENVEPDFTSVLESFEVYQKSYEANVTSDLISYALEEEPNTALFFDREVGFAQTKTVSGADTIVSKEYLAADSEDEVVKSVGTSLTRLDFTTSETKSGVLWVEFNPANVEYEDDDYISFSIYPKTPANVSTVWVRLGRAPGVQVVANSWGLVTFNAKAFLDYKYLRFDINSYADGDEVSLYFSKATIIPSEQVKNLTENAATDTYQVGDITLVGTAKKSNWGSDLRTDIFNQSTELNPTLINGQILYYGWAETTNGGKFGNRQLGLEFQTALTGKVYIVARGLSTIIADGKMPYLNLYTSRSTADNNVNNRIKWVPSAIIGSYSDGYQVYEFDFGTASVGYVLLFSRTELAGQQILIKNITQTKPTDMIPV